MMWCISKYGKTVVKIMGKLQTMRTEAVNTLFTDTSWAANRMAGRDKLPYIILLPARIAQEPKI